MSEIENSQGKFVKNLEEEEEEAMMGEEDTLGFDDGDDGAGSSDFGNHFEIELGDDDDSISRQEGINDCDFQYHVLTPKDIVQSMDGTVHHVTNVLKIPATVARRLLIHYKWDKDELYAEDRLFNGHRDAVYKEAHVINPDTVNTRSSVALTEYCGICFSTVKGSSLTGIECNHKFCADCWSDYFTNKIMEESMGQTITCAAHGCDIIVDDITVMKLVKESKVKLKYQHLITNSFVECKLLMRLCPAPHCPNAIKAYYTEAQSVTCTCGHTCCFDCGENWHDPVKCSWLKKWIKKEKNPDPEGQEQIDNMHSLTWIATHTKECPECHVSIEKNGGCNHMVCWKQNCKAKFCWVCLGPWEPHGSSGYNCNRYDEDDARKARNNQAQSIQVPESRFLFYYARYVNHMQSLGFEKKLYAEIKRKMEEMQQHNMSWIEVQFLKKAVDVLGQCRSTLMYTYVFAFYLKKNNQSLIFEENQKDLENATETLSEYLERDITSDAQAEIKQKVQDKSRYCESRRKAALKHVHEGYEKDLWEYYDN